MLHHSTWSENKPRGTIQTGTRELGRTGMAGRGCLVSLLVTTHSCSTRAYRLAIDAPARTWLCWRHKAVVVIELGRSGPQCCSDFAARGPILASKSAPRKLRNCI